MAPSFSKNAILMGVVDHFCLVCEAYLKSEEDILVHIGKPVHTKSLDATQYVDILKKDHIRKIKNKYFCEFCNFLMNTLAKVRLHIDGQKHVQNTHNLSLNRKGKAVIAFDDTLITEQAWNGLHDNTCALCNIEYEDENIHKTQTTHVLNLVQIKVEQDEDKNIYRKIDESIFHCLTCNNVSALASIALHWNTPEHKIMYERCRGALESTSAPIILSKSQFLTENIKDIQKSDITQSVELRNYNNFSEKTNQLDTKKTDPEASSSSVLNKELTNRNKTMGNENRTDIFDSLSWLQKNELNIMFETDIAYCKKCSTTLTLDIQDIKEHIKRHQEVNSNNDTALNTTSHAVLKDDKKDEAIKSTSHVVLKDDKKDEAIKSTSHVVLKDDKKDEAMKSTSHVVLMDDKKVETIKSISYVVLKDDKNDEAIKSTSDVVLKDDKKDEAIKSTSHIVLKDKNDEAIKSTSDVVLKDDKKEEINAFSFKSEKGRAKTLADYDHIESNQCKDSKPKNKTPLNQTSPAKLNNDDKDTQKTSILKTEKEEIEEIARTNNMELDDKETNIYCKTCEIRISNSLKSINNHIKTWVHKKKIQKQKTKKVHLKKICFAKYMNNLIDTNPWNINSDIVINENICVTFFSFMFFTSIMGDNQRVRCQACEKNLLIPDLLHHKKKDMHSAAMRTVPVIKSEELTSEFVREVRPNIYHCGFCNLICSSWENMELHLKSVEHHNEKRQSVSRLQLHMPMIRHHRLQRHIEKQYLNILLNGLFQ